MRPRLLALRCEARDPGALAQFWARLLGRRVVTVGSGAAAGAHVPSGDAELDLRFVTGRAPGPERDRVHLHLASTSPDHQRRTVAEVIRLGGRHLDVGQRPDEGHVVLADPEGNELCVIEAGNAYLAGCGLLAEVACAGTWELGRFWSEALGWPLVWDRDSETAVQSPQGGTKIAWDGAPVAPGAAPARQRLELSADGSDLQLVVDRLVSLGAVRLAGDETGTVLADPDGGTFHLTVR